MKCDKGHIPELITRKQLVTDVHVKQKAVAMLTLLFTLPHILGKHFKLENEHYKHLVHFIQVTQLTQCDDTITKVLMSNIKTLEDIHIKGNCENLLFFFCIYLFYFFFLKIPIVNVKMTTAYDSL